MGDRSGALRPCAPRRRRGGAPAAARAGRGAGVGRRGRAALTWAGGLGVHAEGAPLRTGTVREPALSDAPAATYVYAVCRGGAETALAGLPGQAPGAPVRLLPFGELTAVVQDVPAAEFSEKSLHERLTDRTDLERCVRAHHAVIAAAATTAPVLPRPLRGPGQAYLNRLRGVRHKRERRQEAGLQATEAVAHTFAGLAVAGRQLRPHGRPAAARSPTPYDGCARARRAGTSRSN